MSASTEAAERRIDDTVRRFFSPAARLDVPGLTGLRALAAFLVVAFHLNGLMAPRRLALGPLDVTPLVTIGWIGVAVFFVLSGFLITAHLIERVAGRAPLEVYPAYLRDRILRVAPAYWAQIAILFVVAWASAGTPPAWSAAVPAHLAFLQNFDMGVHSAINGVYWTLPVEFMFYLVAPFAVALAWRPDSTFGVVAIRALAVAVLGIAIAVGWRAFSVAHWGAQGVPALFWASSTHLPGNTDQFGLGMAAAMLFMARGAPDATKGERRVGAASDALVLAGLGGLAAAMYLLDARVGDYWRGSLLFYGWLVGAGAAITALVVGVAARGAVARALFENRLALWLGAISYSVYLWHWILAPVLAAELPGSGRAVFALVALPAIVAASAASYYLVERPFLRMKRGAAPAARAIQ